MSEFSVPIDLTVAGQLKNHGQKRLYTDVSSTDSFDVYHYADQTNANNQTRAFCIHNYTDAVAATIDNVGAKQALILRQAHNSSERSDQATDYVGTGIFLDVQRTLVGGATGNLGSGNDRLTMIDPNGNLAFYRDFDGAANVAPIQIGTYTHFLQRTLYLGYDDADNKAIIGAVDLDTSTQQPIAVLTSLLDVSGDIQAAIVHGTQVSAPDVVTDAITCDGATLTIKNGSSVALLELDTATGVLTLPFGVLASGLPTVAGAAGTLYVDGTGTVKRA